MVKIVKVFSLMIVFFVLACPTLAFSEKTIVSLKVDSPVNINGVMDDQAWQKATPIAIKDGASGAIITLRSVYTTDDLYFSVQFPDSAQNFLHNPWIWNKEKGNYEEGAHREDTFVFKWNMMEKDVNLSNFSDDSYTADVWYWKANRTNPAGYADDKHQILGDYPTEKATELQSATGKSRFLVRRSDTGKAAYKELKPNAYQGDILDRYPKSTPEGSRADVEAKGHWKDGFWFIEFKRKLATGNSDDVQFSPSKKKEYLFGVSIFSLYGRPHDPNSPNFYGRGRISEPLHLIFEK